MNLIGAIYAIRRYGFRGVIDYLIRFFKTNRTEQFLREKCVAATPQPGITIIGTFDHPSSLSKTLRDFAIMLKRAQIPHQAFNISCGHPIPDSEFIHLITPKNNFISNKYTHVIGMERPYAIPDSRCQICVIHFWEFEDGFKANYPAMNWLKNIIAMSDFNFNCFRRSLPNASVSKILYPFQFIGTRPSEQQKEQVRARYGISANDFVVFFNFSYLSSYYRKNPEGLIRAFAKAFRDIPQAKLVLKTMGAKSKPELHERLMTCARENKVYDRLICIGEYMSQVEIIALTSIADVYASLHRGEGFGIGIAEAMTLGVPVVVTDYSAPTEFCNSRDSLPIPYRLVKVQPSQVVDFPGYKHVTYWAEPDINLAAAALRRLYDEPELRKSIGINGKRFIEEYFSVQNFAGSIRDFIFHGQYSQPQKMSQK